MSHRLMFQHVGRDESMQFSDVVFSEATIDTIYNSVKTLLTQYNENGSLTGKPQPIVVPKSTIRGVLDSIYADHTPAVGDMFTRTYHRHKRRNDIHEIIDKTIEHIVSSVRNTLEMEQHNSTLDKFDTVLGDFNRHGLRSHSKIKIRENRLPFQINMRY